MVEPSALAETVTPPTFSPAAATDPDRIASAACAGTKAVVETSAARRPASVAPARLMASSPDGPVGLSVGVARILALRRRSRRRRGWRRHGLEIGRDGGDLTLVEVIFEARHARRPVGDHLPHHV